MHGARRLAAEGRKEEWERTSSCAYKGATIAVPRRASVHRSEDFRKIPLHLEAMAGQSLATVSTLTRNPCIGRSDGFRETALENPAHFTHSTAEGVQPTR
jgi:hypothetical protein